MVRNKEVYRRLGHCSGDDTYKLVIPPALIDSMQLKVGQVLYLRNIKGVLRYSDIVDPLARKLKIGYQKGVNVYSVRVPKRIVLHQGWKPRQQFNLRSGPNFIIFDPFTYYGGSTLVGVAEPKKVVNNLPSCKEGVVSD